MPRQAVVLAVAVDPDQHNRLWAGYYAPGGLAVSHDGGQTWDTVASGLGDNPVFDLLALPGGQLWAATRDGLLESSDAGASWRPARGNLLGAAFALEADQSGRIYVGLDDAGLYAGQPDEGRWTPLAPDEAKSAAILSLAVSPDGTQLYAGTAGQGLFASRDAGRTWTTAFPGDYVPDLALDQSGPEIAMASLRDRLVRTRDGGRTWETVAVPWAGDEVVSLLWSSNSTTGMDGEFWAGSGRGRVYVSSDGGDSWREGGNGLPAEGGVLSLATTGLSPVSNRPRLIAGAWTGVYASDDGGQHWTYLSPALGAPNAHALLAVEGGLLLGTRTGLYRWQGAQDSWVDVLTPYIESAQLARVSESPRTNASLPGGIAALAMAPSDERVIYAGGPSGGLYRSQDGGTSWTRVPSDLGIGARALAVAPDDAQHVYMLANWERLYVSADGGKSWQARWTGLGVTTEAISLAIDPLQPSLVYMGTDTGMYRSYYEGEDWRPVGRPLDDQTVLTLVARTDPSAPGVSTALYIGGTRGAYRSLDHGDSASIWGRGLEQISVTAFLFDAVDPRIVYAGTAYHGLYQSLDGGETWQPIGPPDLSDQVVEALAWGPEGELFAASPGGVWVRKTDD